MTSWKEWAAEHMEGIENQLMPSFTPDLEELDEEGVRWDVQRTKDHGFFATMCTSEAGLEFEEAKQFVSIVADEAGESLSTSTTVMFDSFERNAEMIEHAADVGLDTVLLGYPLNWVPDSGEEAYERTAEMAAAADIGIVLHLNSKYNFEGLHPSGTFVEQLDRMADIENAVAVEVSDPELVGLVDRICGDRLLLSSPIEGMAPNHVQTYDMQWMGAGPYEVYQSPEQPLLVEYFRALRAGEFEEAIETYWRLTPVRGTFMQQMTPQLRLGTYHFSQHKYYQWLVGGNGGYTRQPAMELADGDKRAIRAAMEGVGLELRENDAEFYAGRVNYGN